MMLGIAIAKLIDQPDDVVCLLASTGFSWKANRPVRRYGEWNNLSLYPGPTP